VVPAENATVSIAVLDDYQRRARELADWDSLGPGAQVTFLHDPIPPDQLIKVLADFEVLVVMRERTALRRPVLEQLPRLRLLVTTGMRNASVDVDCLRERGVVMCGTGLAGERRSGVPGTAEVAWALILAASKRVTIEDRAVRAGRWQLDLPMTLAGRTLGLAGLGNLGASMVGPARAFGMDVIAWSRNLSTERAASAGARLVSKAELLASSDVLSVHLVLGERTCGLFTGADLAQMKPTAILVNTSRGPIVDTNALVEALRSGTIAAAGLDVYDMEPLPTEHPLTTLDNVILLPHLGYVNEPAFRVMYTEAVENIATFLAGSPVRVLT
jgi:phosphoglycerate dehydrogenase-like enzyme